MTSPGDQEDVVSALTEGIILGSITHGISADLAWHLLTVLDRAGYSIVKRGGSDGDASGME